ncbi:MAG: ABC transporter permease, partial [Verrucomicrobiota bacterium]
SGAETVENVQVEHGRFISDLDVKQRLPVIVLGSRAYEAGFRRAKQAIGKTIYIAGEPFVVVGTTKHLENSSGGRNTLRWFNAYVYVPITTAMDLWGGENPQITDLSVRIDSAREMDAALALIDNTLRQTHRGIEDYEFDTNAEQLEELKALERSFTLSLGSLAAISLLVGGIGIMNVMLASVNERIREIGVRKALGARAGDVFIQFIAEAFVISTIGGLLGLAASLGMLDILQDILPDGGEIPSAPLGAMAVAFLFSVSMGVVSGIYPALRAARLSPIDALRHE